MSYSGTTMITRFEFIKSLAHDLIVPHLLRRIENNSQSSYSNFCSLATEIGKILGNPPSVTAINDLMLEGKSFDRCSPESDRQTQLKCFKYSTLICGQYQIRSCLNCATDTL